MFLLVAACLVASAYAKNCCSPSLWEGNLGMVIASRTPNTTGHLTQGTIRMALNANTRMIAQTQNLETDGYAYQQRIIIDYNKGIMNIIKSDGSCTRAPSGDWIPNCIPDNATVSDVYFGLDSNHVSAKSYNMKFPTSDIYMTVTADTCVPLTEDVTGVFDGKQVIERIVFVDVTAGIKDSSVFNVPAQCNQVVVGPPIPELGRRSLFR